MVMPPKKVSRAIFHMIEPDPKRVPSAGATLADSTRHTEITRIIGNARFEHNVCVMARKQYGMGEFGRLFYLMLGVNNRKLEELLDFIDEVRRSHRYCLPCSLKFLAFCRVFCGIQLPDRQAAYEREYYDRLEQYGPGRDFMDEVWEAIDKARPVAAPKPPPNSRLRNRSLMIFPTEIRVFRGDFEK
jgi:hypothetical protein